MKRKVVHIIGGLELGGAETMLLNISCESNGFTHKIFSLGPNDINAARFRSAGRDVRTFGLRGALASGSIFQTYRAGTGLFRLAFELWQESPDLVQTWMYQSDIIGGVLGRLLGKKVIWGIFNSNLSPNNYSRRTNRVISACGVLAKWIPATIVACSEKGSASHREIGYPNTKIVGFPTGVDIGRFQKTILGRQMFRAANGVQPNRSVIGMLARWDVQKDHRTLLRSFEKVTRKQNELELWLAGGYGIDESNSELMAMIRELRLDDRVKLFGSLSEDLVKYYSSLDIFVLSSLGEGVPNVLLEAMSIGLPCIASEVGDVKRVLNDVGIVVPPGDIDFLASSIDTVLSLSKGEREDMGARSREKVLEHYSQSQMIESFSKIYEKVLTP
jgi:glycosyltransferase involved in cell wall biosynthesis